ncbi:uncharacterized protein DUF4826 [Mucilaginibacter oryzae]|uniref:Uncharacterized protein DUF4826 n=1 Tax=Mucilaginibacter oryzae TaxID=468058 RepID=A0A316HHF9_9SPHI|nr:DUF4826 family protein [Mucilaginibacter oryzae]PWK80614.1 uncharacterized protein DUF4826 [Mucilaginibacter oryzae]
MVYPINYKNIGTDTEFCPELHAMYREAIGYLQSFIWCRAVKDCFLYTNLGSVFCIFLFEIENTQSTNDNFLWVITGDIPPMYLDVHGCLTTRSAIKSYIALAKQWVENVKNGKSLTDCYPLNAAPTIELAKMLEKRIAFIEYTLMDNVDDLSWQIGK